MKDFDKFVKEISTNEKVTDMFQQANLDIDSLRTSDYQTGDQIAGLSYSIALQMIRSYHEWLHRD